MIMIVIATKAIGMGIVALGGQEVILNGAAQTKDIVAMDIT
jgi:hypothetical protein